MDLVTVLRICFAGILVVTGLVYGINLKKKYDKDPITGEFIPYKEIKANAERRLKQDPAQLIYDERCQIDEVLRRIGEVCSEFHQKYGKAIDILCHTKRMKVLIREYKNIPNEKELIDYQNRFYLKTYESIHKDLYNVTEPYLVGKKEIDRKYKGRIDLRIELNKFVAHLEKLKQIINSSSQTP